MSISKKAAEFGKAACYGNYFNSLYLLVIPWVSDKIGQKVICVWVSDLAVSHETQDFVFKPIAFWCLSISVQKYHINRFSDSDMADVNIAVMSFRSGRRLATAVQSERTIVRSLVKRTIDEEIFQRQGRHQSRGSATSPKVANCWGTSNRWLFSYKQSTWEYSRQLKSPQQSIKPWANHINPSSKQYRLLRPNRIAAFNQRSWTISPNDLIFNLHVSSND